MFGRTLDQHLLRRGKHPVQTTPTNDGSSAQLIVSDAVSTSSNESTNPLAAGSLAGKRVLVTGSSRGIGADTISYFAGAGARVVINYRNKEARALKLVAALEAQGAEASAIGADLTEAESVAGMVETIGEKLGGLDILVLNASGGMESGMAADYAMQLNRDAQVNFLTAMLPLLGAGSRVVFVTSHQAHFIKTVETMPEYLPVALSKRAGEDALRDLIPQLTEAGIEFVVVSGDMIEGTITATLLQRANPGAIEARKEAAGRLYNVGEFAAEVALAAVEEIPDNNTRYVGDVTDFLKA
jgi:NAD(P)-dependent dehydrogenase (short-subunit alcohol dehydrogenase family)